MPRECYFIFSPRNAQLNHKFSIDWGFDSNPVLWDGGPKRAEVGKSRAGKLTLGQSFIDRDESRRGCTPESIVPTQSPWGDFSKESVLWKLIASAPLYLFFFFLDTNDSFILKMPNIWLMEGLFHVETKGVWGIRVTLKVMGMDKKLTTQGFRKIGRSWVTLRTKKNWEYLYWLVLFSLKICICLCCVASCL